MLRAAQYRDEAEEVEFGEIHLFVGPSFVLTVRHCWALGPEAVLYAVLDAVVDGDAPVVAGLQNDIDEIETEVFGGDPKVSRRIYELSGEVIEFQRATRPLLDIMANLEAGFDKYGTDDELRRYLRDVVKKISAWAAILFAPTLIGTIYGMNFEHMPELGWLLGYPFAIALMALVCTWLYVVFKRRDWL